MKRFHPKDDPAFLLRRQVGKRPVPHPKASQPEDTTLAQACAFLDAERIEWFHMPPWLLELAFGVERDNPDPLVREAAGDVRGLPDLLLFYRGRYLAVELKTEIGTETRHQRTWRARLNGMVCRTLAEFTAAVTEWKAICDT